MPTRKSTKRTTSAPLARSTPLFQRTGGRSERDGPSGSTVKGSADRKRDGNNNEPESPSLEYRRDARSRSPNRRDSTPSDEEDVRSTSRRESVDADGASNRGRAPSDEEDVRSTSRRESVDADSNRGRAKKDAEKSKSSRSGTPRRSRSPSHSRRSPSRSPSRKRSAGGKGSKTGSNKSTSKKTSKNTPKKKKITQAGKEFTVSYRIMKEMMWYQNTTKLLVPKVSFCRLVRELIAKHDPTYRIQTEALEALQEATEAFTVHYLSDSNLCTAHANRKTLFPSDMRLVRELKHVHLFMGVDNR